MRLKKPIIALAAVSALALTACGGSGSGSGGNENEAANNENSAEIGQDPDREGPVTIEGAQEGGTVNLISVAGLNSMDPSEAYYQNTISLLTGLVTRTLTQYVYDEETNSMVLVPDLATDLGTPNEDFTEWSFTLRDGIKYEDGTDVEPEDIVFALKRSMDRTQFPEGAAYSNDYFVDGDTYQGPYTDPRAEWNGATIEGNTITISMNKPFPDMPYWGTFPAMTAIPEGDESAPDAYRLRPLATGPYMFDEYSPEKSLTLVRNPNWDPDTDPGRTAYPDSYVFDFDTPTEQIEQRLLADTGEAQTTLTYDDIQSANYAEADESGRLVIGSFPLTSYWAPDYRKVTDLRVRQALAYAYPYEDAYLAGGLIEGVTAVPGDSLLPPGTPGRVEFNPIPDHEIGSTDTDAARALLEEADAVGFEVRWPYAQDDPTAVAVKDQIAASLEEAGFDPSPVPSTLAELSTVRANPDANINIRPAGWIADWPSGGSWFPPLIESTNLNAEGLGSNYSVFSEPDVDAQIAEILAMPVEDQADAWGALDESVMTEYLPLFVTRYGGVAQLHGSQIQGHFIDNTSGMPTWKSMYIGES